VKFLYLEKPVQHLDGKLRDNCKYCKKYLVSGRSENETSTLFYHTYRCEKKSHDRILEKLVLDHMLEN